MQSGGEAWFERDLDVRVGQHEVDGEKQAGGLVIPRRLYARAARTLRSLADIGPRLRELEIIPDLVQTYA